MRGGVRVITSLAAVLVLNTPIAGLAGLAAHQHPAGAGVHGYATPSVPPQAAPAIAITEIQSSAPSARQGDMVDVDVTVRNQGDEAETFTLSLWDDTDSQEINAVTLTLDANQVLTIGFRWDTARASPRAHVLTAAAHTPGDPNNSYDALSLPAAITVTLAQITFDLLALPKATFGQGLTLTQPQVTTPAAALDQVFLADHHASIAGSLVRAGVIAPGTPLQGIYVANAGATFQPAGTLQNPFLQGEVRGTLRLQGRSSSLGAYVQARGNTHFVAADGSLRITLSPGTFDLILDSPGYVPVRISGASIEPGETLTLPEMTLPFGDANGDGKIDILDLSIAASNFGVALVEMPAP